MKGLTFEQALKLDGWNRLRDFENCRCTNHGKKGCDWTTKNCIGGTRSGVICTPCLMDVTAGGQECK